MSALFSQSLLMVDMWWRMIPVTLPLNNCPPSSIMSGSPRYIFNDDWFHCTAAATAVRPQNNHLLADLKQNCFHSSVLLIWSVSVRTCSEQRGGGADRAGNESPRSFHNCGGGGHKDHNGWAGWLAYSLKAARRLSSLCWRPNFTSTYRI